MRSIQRAVLLVSLALIVFSLAWWLLAPRPRLSIDAQIAQSLRDAEEAARRGDVNGVLDAVSDDFSAGMLTKPRLRLLLLRARQSARGVDYEIQVNPPQILPARADRPQERVVISRFTAFDGISGASYWATESLTLMMRVERRSSWMPWAGECWRIVGVPNLPPIPVAP
jgi:hypothetical protein